MSSTKHKMQSFFCYLFIAQLHALHTLTPTKKVNSQIYHFSCNIVPNNTHNVSAFPSFDVVIDLLNIGTYPSGYIGMYPFRIHLILVIKSWKPKMWDWWLYWLWLVTKDYSNSIANALDLPQFRVKPSRYEMLNTTHWSTFISRISVKSLLQTQQL